MLRRPTSLVPHLPAALLLLWSGGSGTFFEGSRGGWAAAGHLALLGFVVAFGVLWPDPLRLGRNGRWLLLALAASVLASQLASPVPRAGRLAVVLLPAFLMVPSAVARCWSDDGSRRLGVRSLALVVAFVAGWSLVDWWRFDTPGASLPLGHRGLLAAWLLALLPLAASPWRDGGVGRAVAGAAALLGLAALLGTGSLAAALAAGAVAVALALYGRRGRLGLVPAAVAAGGVLLAVQLPRLGAVLGGSDTSAAARWSYLRAGWRGWLERPALGWGPGSARWTLGEHLRPIPGVHPPDEVVADPHSLPLLVGYELGAGGLLLAIGLVAAFLRRRPPTIADPGLRRAALLGLAALAAICLAERPLAAAAIPLAAMLGVGAVLAAEAPAARRTRWRASSSIAAAVIMAALVAPLDLAHLAYDRALDAGGPDAQARHLRQALALDPDFPLYAARLAWLEAGSEDAGRDAARRALRAAEGARAVAPLWSVAGMLGQEAGEAWSRDALLRACRLSPLGVIAPYRLTLEAAADDLRTRWMARTLRAEPLLMAAVAWRGRGPELRAAVDLLGGVDGVDAGWHAWLEQAVEAWVARPSDGGPARRLALTMDVDASTSASLYAFRRRPWPVDLARIEIYGGALDVVEPGADGWPRGVAVSGDPSCGLSGEVLDADHDS